MKKLTGSKFCASQVAMIAALAVCLMSGCASMTSKKIDSYGKIAEAYYNAPNVAQCIVVDNTNANQVAEFTVRNFTHFEMNMPTPPKTIIPREESAVSGFWDALKTVAPYALLYGIFTDGGFGSRTTINNAAATP